MIVSTNASQVGGRDDLAAMLVTEGSAGAIAEVNIRALKPRVDVTRSPKQGYQWPHKKDTELKRLNAVA